MRFSEETTVGRSITALRKTGRGGRGKRTELACCAFCHHALPQSRPLTPSTRPILFNTFLLTSVANATRQTKEISSLMTPASSSWSGDYGTFNSLPRTTVGLFSPSFEQRIGTYLCTASIAYRLLFTAYPSLATFASRIV